MPVTIIELRPRFTHYHRNQANFQAIVLNALQGLIGMGPNQIGDDVVFHVYAALKDDEGKTHDFVYVLA